MHIDLSVIIPVKNEEKFLEKCLKALNIAVKSSKLETEIIIVDNGSTDSTRDIAKAYGCIIIDRPVDKIASLRNAGAEHSQGAVLAFLDADCLVDDKWILFCLEAFAKKEIGIVGTRAIPDLENATWVEMAWYKLFSGAKRPDYPDWIGTSNIFVRKADFLNIRGFDENFETAEDVNFCYEMRKTNKYIFLEKRINTIHLRESKTIIELFRRELWRGKNSLKSYVKNPFSFRELRGIAVPAANGVSLLSIFVFLLFKSYYALLGCLVVILLPLVLMKMKKITFHDISEIVLCFVVAQVYIFARTCSFFLEMYLALKLHLIRQNI